MNEGKKIQHVEGKLQREIEEARETIAKIEPPEGNKYVLTLPLQARFRTDSECHRDAELQRENLLLRQELESLASKTKEIPPCERTVGVTAVCVAGCKSGHLWNTDQATGVPGMATEQLPWSLMI